MPLPDTYPTDLLNEAIKSYPFVKQHNPAVVLGTGQGYAETYPVGETGRPLAGGGFSRPGTLPIDRVGIEIYKPDQFSAKDLAAEMLHVDPMANKTRDGLIKSWTPEQLNALKEHALDYQATLDEGRPEQDAIQNATDSALRGYTVGQWPEEVNQALAYTPEQLQMLNALKSYMTAEPIALPEQSKGGAIERVGQFMNTLGN